MPKRITPFRDLRRRKWRVEPKQRLLICCEGKVTEPSYFGALKAEVRNSLLEIQIYGRGESPKTLVESAVERKRWAEKEAARLKDDTVLYDEVWCVFDVDSHPNIPDAKQQATDNNVRLAISNPCFEVWMLLHFQEQTAYIDRGHLKRACCKHVKNYKKEIPYDTVRPTYGKAVTRAKNLDRMHVRSGKPGANPSTGVYGLTERIYELAGYTTRPA